MEVMKKKTLNPSRLYLRDLNRYEKQDLADFCKVSLPYVYAIAAGTRSPSVKLALAMEVATLNRVRFADFIDEKRG